MTGASSLVPRNGALFVVRWRQPGGNIAHRYYRRRADAERLRAWFLERDRTAVIFRTEVAWRWAEEVAR